MNDSSIDHRRRLLDAMARAVSAKGYSAVTIADLATEARVSKRSFYEQFRDKADCFIALYEVASLNALKVLQEALDPKRDWQTQVEQVLAAYLKSLADNPSMLSTLFIDIMAIGPTGLAARRRTTLRFAEFMVVGSRQTIGLERAVAVIGGLHEWVLQILESGQTERLPQLARPGAELVLAAAPTSHVRAPLNAVAETAGG